MYYRLLSPLILLKELDRILYLDPDILIINQVRLDTEHEYFNSGVLLIDLNTARKLVTSNDIFDCVRQHEKELILPDQDVFNILYKKYTIPVNESTFHLTVVHKIPFHNRYFQQFFHNQILLPEFHLF